jgi:hypothetical protein
LGEAATQKSFASNATGASLRARTIHKRLKMKSAYELAMERLEKASPSISLTEDQKKEIAEVDSTYRAKIAEKEVFLKDQIRKAQSAGNLEEAESLEKQRASDIRRLQGDCEAKKEKLRAKFTAP